MNRLKRLWRDPVWSKVISGLILAVWAGAVTRFLGWWPRIAAMMAFVVNWLRERSVLPNWATMMLIAVVAASALSALRRFAKVLAATSAAGPHWSTYTSDEFFGLRWRWRYAGGDIVDAWTFCPSCDLQVYPRNASAYSSVDRIAFKCESCGRELATMDEPYEAVKDRAIRFIQQRLRTGAWKARVAEER